MLSVKDYVNEAPSSNAIGSVDPYLSEVDLPSPIDAYIGYSRSLLGFGTSGNLSANPHLGGLLLLGVVSAAEAYFRSSFSFALEVCPIAREVSAEKQINLGGVLWHGQSEFRRSAFEHLTFCSGEDVKRHAFGYLKFKMRDAEFSAPLDEYEKVCHLRHGLVHNAGILPGRNAVQIGAKSYKRPVKIDLDFGRLQNLIAAVDTLVLTFNRELFDELCKRWATSWRQRADWDAQLEEKLFNYVWKSHFCRKLNVARPGRSGISRSSCLAKIKEQYDL